MYTQSTLFWCFFKKIQSEAQKEGTRPPVTCAEDSERSSWRIVHRFVQASLAKMGERSWHIPEGMTTWSKLNTKESKRQRPSLSPLSLKPLTEPQGVCGKAHMIDTRVPHMSAIKSVLKATLHFKRHRLSLILRSKYIKLKCRHFQDKLHQLMFKCRTFIWWVQNQTTWHHLLSQILQRAKLCMRRSPFIISLKCEGPAESFLCLNVINCPAE